MEIDKKIKSLAQLKKIIFQLQAKGKKIVFTNGCFDILHYGHVKYLSDAKKNGDILVVAINTDTSVKKIKGKNRPIVNQADRARVVAGLASVDFVVLFNQQTPLETITALKPDILVKGGDWKKKDIVGADFVCGRGGKVLTINFLKNRSTTGLIKKIAKIF
ncbi:MAG: D-glycero-beta-D-manno-heptose 1-phosphate adenylyltransferase [Candidatus Omnitrophica bacterium]|nr:D-glycero-beta-D-manno-heptose 1-phosphate adenylyltransferase [Candidatus Omnitrophota bacterium]